jgi:hypothetical protein
LRALSSDDRRCRRGAVTAIEQLVTALSLALDDKFGGGDASDGAGHLEKLSSVAGLELDFDLA